MTDMPEMQDPMLEASGSPSSPEDHGVPDQGRSGEETLAAESVGQSVAVEVQEPLTEPVEIDEPITDEEEAELRSVIEALVFASDEPISAKFMRQIIEEINKDRVESNRVRATTEGIKRAVAAINRSYPDRAFHIISIAGGFAFATKPKYSAFVGKLAKEKARRKLSATAIESLAIIAYKQPITKSEIEFIRGVNADYIIKTLLEKNLITITGRASTPGRPLLYGTTDEFLKHFGLNEITDLPKPREIEELIGETELEVEKRLLAEQQELEFKEELSQKLEGGEKAKPAGTRAPLRQPTGGSTIRHGTAKAEPPVEGTGAASSTTDESLPPVNDQPVNERIEVEVHHEPVPAEPPIDLGDAIGEASQESESESEKEFEAAAALDALNNIEALQDEENTRDLDGLREVEQLQAIDAEEAMKAEQEEKKAAQEAEEAARLLREEEEFEALLAQEEQERRDAEAAKAKEEEKEREALRAREENERREAEALKAAQEEAERAQKEAEELEAQRLREEQERRDAEALKTAQEEEDRRMAAAEAARLEEDRRRAEESEQAEEASAAHEEIPDAPLADGVNAVHESTAATESGPDHAGDMETHEADEHATEKGWSKWKTKIKTFFKKLFV